MALAVLECTVRRSARAVKENNFSKSKKAKEKETDKNKWKERLLLSENKKNK